MFKRLLKVDVADTPSKQQRGLMFVEKLGEDEGMLFKFKLPQNLSFWGVNTYIPLAIAFVSPEKEIKKIDFISPLSNKTVESNCDCTMAIEANYDFFNKNRICVGHKVDIIENKGNVFVKFLGDL